jgi:hypothetical protein
MLGGDQGQKALRIEGGSYSGLVDTPEDAFMPKTHRPTWYRINALSHLIRTHHLGERVRLEDLQSEFPEARVEWRGTASVTVYIDGLSPLVTAEIGLTPLRRR